MDLNPNKLVKSNSTDDSLFLSNREELGNEEDDPLSIKGKSLSILGFILAAMAIVLPSISVFFERPFLHGTGFYNEKVNKDGY